MTAYTTKISHAISDAKKEQWDAIAPDPFMTYGWLQTVEKTYVGNVRPTYHTVWDKDMLVGAAICYILEKYGYFTPGVVEQLLSEHRSRKKNWAQLLFAVLGVQTWHRLFIENDLSLLEQSI